MQTDNRILDDIAKVVNGFAGTVAGMGREAESGARARAREWIGGLDFVSREEFDTVKAMAVAARDEADALRARLDALEAKAGEAKAGEAKAGGYDTPASTTGTTATDAPLSGSWDGTTPA
jgi:BMFP domain-containing protein YqiC